MTKYTSCTKWDARHFAMAELVASWSEDRNRKVGAVISGEGNETIGIGYNGLPRKISSSVENRHSRTNGEKYYWFEHAERNAIFNTLRTGGQLKNATIYSSSFPCADCARAMIQCGISHLKTFSFDLSDHYFKRHFEVSSEMLFEAGLAVSLFDRNDELILQTRRNFFELRGSDKNLLR